MGHGMKLAIDAAHTHIRSFRTRSVAVRRTFQELETEHLVAVSFPRPAPVRAAHAACDADAWRGA